VPSGSQVLIDYRVTNPGNSPANNVELTTTIGGNLVVASVVCETEGLATCPPQAGTTRVASLPAGSSLHFKVTANVPAGTRGDITCSGSVTADGEQVTTNNSAQLSFNVYTADIRVSATAIAPEFSSGGTAVYAMTVRNLGQDAAHGVMLYNVTGVDQTLESITCEASGGGACPTFANGVANVPVLGGGSALTFTVTNRLNPVALGAVSNTMRAVAEGDAMSSDNEATASATTRVDTSPQTTSFVILRSSFLDYMGAGQDHRYDRSNAILTVNDADGYIGIDISGFEDWHGDFVLPASLTRVATGVYSNLARYPTHDPAAGGLHWSSVGRTCSLVDGSFTIDDVSYTAGGELASFDLRFEQRCNGGAGTLRGQIHWVANDGAPPLAPVNPPPDSLWQPSPGETPALGNYVYLKGDATDWVGNGRTELFTTTNSVIELNLADDLLSFQVTGDQNWRGQFKGMVQLQYLQPGYYGNLDRYTFHNPVVGGMNVDGQTRGCNYLSGWFAIDAISVSNGALESVELRFEQHCEKGTGALRGKIRWSASDPITPAPGPVDPPPAGLWAPSSGATPASGNYVYLQSDTGDWVGQGRTFTYTQVDSVLNVSASGGLLTIKVAGEEDWTGNFRAMNSLTQLQPGYYGNLRRAGFHNPRIGGIDFYGDGRGCNLVTGWFVIDDIAYSNGNVSSLDLRFIQHCDGRAEALRGKIHWAPGDSSQPAGPQNPVPAGLWEPAPGATPASGNYFYTESDVGDFIGGGKSHTFTHLNSVLDIRASGNHLSVAAFAEKLWMGEFQAMNTLSRLAPGYYGNLKRYPFNNPTMGGLEWTGAHRGCNELSGWFVIDEISHSTDGSLLAVTLRFEQHCEFAAPATRGKIRWRATDVTQAPGPLTPLPTGLWAPAPGATPASGNYVYLKSDGDFVGAGLEETYTPQSHQISVTSPARGQLALSIQGSRNWNATFLAMVSLNELQPGYYGTLHRYPFGNPAKGALSWYGESRACNEVTGWFVVDSVSYSGGVLASIDLRFEQNCENVLPSLHGKIHWVF
jgi:hypothetical protein